jgi:hypothetical protein
MRTMGDKVEQSLKLKEVLDLNCAVNEATCSSEAVKLFVDPRCRFIVTPHPARMYRQFPRVFIHLNIVQMMDLCLTNNRLPQKSESLKISPDRYSPPDSLWSREVARWLFVEVWITATFLLEMNCVCLFGDQVFEEIRKDVQDDHLHLAIAGGGSFTEMSLSLLARFDCRDFGGRSSKVNAKFVIEPRLKRTVTPDTKLLVKEIEAGELQDLNPSTRLVRRVSSRGDKIFIPVLSIGSTEIGKEFDEEGLKTEIKLSVAENRLIASYSSVLAGTHQRLWKKADNIRRVSKAGAGGSILAEYIRAEGRFGVYWKPSILLFCSARPSATTAKLDNEKFTISSIVEIFYLTRVRSASDCVSDYTAIDSIDIICKSGSGSGSFTGSDKLKHGILHGILRSQVSLLSTSNI